jgi:hypothetical protein
MRSDCTWVVSEFPDEYGLDRRTDEQMNRNEHKDAEYLHLFING